MRLKPGTPYSPAEHSIIELNAPIQFCQRGSKFDGFFLADEGIEAPNVTINGPSSARQPKHHLNGISLVAHEHSKN